MAVLVGIAGGSGSGKTTVAAGVARAMGETGAVVIAHDAYYRDLAHVPADARAQSNFDHPDALDNERLIADLQCLRGGGCIALPSYDYVSHTRCAGTIRIEPRPIVIVEGILVLAVAELRALFDFGIFVDASSETRLGRRVARDVHERGRSVASVIAQYERTTLPMHQQWVEPSRRYADVSVSGESELHNTIATIVAHLRRCMPEK